MALKMDLSKTGLRMFFKDYQEEAFRYLWSLGEEGAGSRKVCEHVNEALMPRTISRAAIIIFLDEMVEIGLLDFSEETGKGGHRRIYRMKHDEAGFKERVAGVFIRSLLRDFPEETCRVLKKL